MTFIFSPTEQKLNRKSFYGFDIETYDRNRAFYCCSVYGDEFRHTFFSKQSFIDLIRSGYFNDSYIVASNLTFDFFGTFFNSDIIPGFSFIFRGSELLFGRTYVYKNRFNRRPSHKRDSVVFLDTFNYAKLSVAKLGKILGLPKLEKPEFLGQRPVNDNQRRQLVEYNMRDAEISQKAIKFFFSTFERLGATAKMTIASTAMSLYKNVHLSDSYYTHRRDVLVEQFKGYYGGRTEAFSRGLIEDYDYYDFNSLYPFSMKNEFPDPNTLRRTYKNTDYYLLSFDGMSDVSLSCPYMEYPLLPVRTEDKLIFPYGSFRGWYTHVELRKALELGYVLTKVHKTYYYTKNCRPFDSYVDSMYKLRLKYKADGSSMEYVVKILLNALYGKFGQKFLDKDNLIPLNHTADELMKFKKFEIVGRDFIRIVEDRFPSPFCIPVWASYVTAYARLLMHRYILLSKPVYCDTDSLITKKRFDSSPELGKLKLEHRVKKGIVVKPKFYAFINETDDETVKIKGIGTKLVMSDFYRLLKNPKISYDKFMKIRESLRRGLIPNEIMEITKELSLEDNKRRWDTSFDSKELQHSRPLELVEGVLVHEERNGYAEDEIIA